MEPSIFTIFGLMFEKGKIKRLTINDFRFNPKNHHNLYNPFNLYNFYNPTNLLTLPPPKGVAKICKYAGLAKVGITFLFIDIFKPSNRVSTLYIIQLLCN
jgi:hypothetical protein